MAITTNDIENTDAEQRHEARITRCNRCRQRIVFLKGEHGLVPVDADEVEAHDDTFDSGLHEDHREIC